MRDVEAEEWAARPADTIETCEVCGDLYEERGDEPAPYLCPDCRGQIESRERRERQVRYAESR